MTIPDYPALSAKLTQQSNAMCSTCGLTVLRKDGRNKPCMEDCPARILLRNAEVILRDYTSS
ncbi:hypothetical protein [Magnetovibrio sp.]|uniref:hypothetical protein n=1 Tax=Magnetovibrio sp. TaxID=2024836 RepID=UPI002F91CDFD